MDFAPAFLHLVKSEGMEAYEDEEVEKSLNSLISFDKFMHGEEIYDINDAGETSVWLEPPCTP